MIEQFLLEIENNGENAGLEFLEKNPSILNETTTDGWSVLQLASFYNLPTIINYSFKHLSSDVINSYNEHPLTLALNENNKEAINILLSSENIAKINTNYKYKSNDNLLFLTLFYNQDESAKIVHNLNGSLYLEKNNQLSSPFLYSIEKNKEEFFNIFSGVNDLEENYDEILIQKTIQNGNRALFENFYPLTNLSTDELFKLAHDFEKPEILASILQSGDFLPGEEQLTKLIDVACKRYDNDNENKACAEIVNYLFDINIPFSKFENENGQSAWMLSIKNRNDFVFKRLSQTLENVNTVDKNQLTPLFYAIETGEANYVKTLLKKRANINVKNRNQDTPLIVAVKKGYKEIVDTLLQFGPQLDEVNTNREHALFLAIKQRNIPIVTSLIWAGAEIATNPFQEVVENHTWQLDIDGKPEIFSYHYDNQVDNFIALSKLGFKLSEKNEDGDTFLIHFIKNGHLSNFKTLMQCSVNPNEKDSNDNTAVMVAATKNTNSYFELLLKRFSNIDFNATNNNKETIIDLCIKNNNLKKIEQIIDYNPKTNENNIDKMFHFVVKHGDLSKHWEYFTEKLSVIEKSLDENKNTPLMLSIISGNTNNFKFLLENLNNKQLKHKNNLNKTTLELIDLIPDQKLKDDFLNILNNQKKTKHP